MKYKPTIKHAKSLTARTISKCGAPLSNPKREAAFNWAFVNCPECRKLKRPDGDIHARFWNKVNKAGPDECWEWTGSRTNYNYGQLWVGKTMKYAHRLSYEFHSGPIPKDMKVCHKCDNTGCVNPSHFFIGTNSDNRQDSLLKDRLGKGRLKLAQVREIRRRAAAGEHQGRIAQDFGITATTVSCIKTRRTWKRT